MPEILAICTANICRSPVVEALLRSRLVGLGHNDWRVASAGTLAIDGYGPAEHSAAVLAERGLDIAAHRSRRAGERDLAAADLVLCMEWGHKEALQVEFSGHRHKIFLLTEMIGDHAEVADPIGGPRAGYERMVDEVTALIDGGLPKIVEVAARNAAGRASPRKP